MDSLKELTFSPVPQVALVGLDAVNNNLHSQIWNILAINRSNERPSLYYKLYNADHYFPIPKNRKSYDRYIPNGIIKKSWLHKHLFEIPSVVAIFEENSCDPPSFTIIKNNVINKISLLKSSLNARQIKFVLVLLQTNIQTIIDDSSHKEFITKLCEDCDINSKLAFIVPIWEQSSLETNFLKIETVFNDLGKSYYLMKSKLIKSHKDLLNKSLQLSLFVRLELKLGFFHEIRQIYNTALSHYKNSYVNLMEIRLTSLNISEIKAVASLLNYKICRLSFYLNNPLEAISSFKKHLEIFRNKFISPEIEFEHYGWLSKQFHMFAELFDMAVNSLNLSPSPNQHPGIYYFESAMFTIRRRSSSENFKNFHKNFSENEIRLLNEILLKLNNSKFIGQMPLDHVDSNYTEYEENRIKAMKYEEQFVDHASFLVATYINVLNNIKKFKKPRFMRYIMYLIGQEYYNLANYEEALNYFTNVTTFYCKEKWPMLHQKVVSLALISSYLMSDLNKFIAYSFECLSNEPIKKKKLNLIGCILEILNLNYKSLHFFDDFEKYTPSLEEKWFKTITELTQKKASIEDISIDMENFSNFIDCNVSFSKTQYFIGETIDIRVCLLSYLPVDLKNVEIQIKLDPFHYNNCSPTEKIHELKANSLNFIDFKLNSVSSSSDKFIKLNELFLKTFTKLPIVLHWSLQNRSSNNFSDETNNENVFTFKKLEENLIAEILEHNSKLIVDVASHMDIFVNENSIIDIKIESKEQFEISNLQLHLKAFTPDDQIDNNYKWFIISDHSLKLIEDKCLIKDKLQPNDTINFQIVFHLINSGNKTLFFHFFYDLLLQKENKIEFITVEKIVNCKTNAIEPFSISCNICNIKNPETANIRVDEPFKLSINFKSQNETIKVLNIEPFFEKSIKVLSQVFKAKFPHILNSKDFEEEYILSCSIESSLFQLGSCSVSWLKKDIPDSMCSILVSNTKFPLPSTLFTQSLIYVELELPEKIYARNPFMAKYKIFSRLEIDTVLEINLGTAEFIMVSGNRSLKTTLSTKSFLELSYIFFPLTCGPSLLPKFDILIHLFDQNPINIDYVNQLIPSTIFVLPKLSTSFNI